MRLLMYILFRWVELCLCWVPQKGERERESWVGALGLIGEREEKRVWETFHLLLYLSHRYYCLGTRYLLLSLRKVEDGRKGGDDTHTGWWGQHLLLDTIMYRCIGMYSPHTHSLSLSFLPCFCFTWFASCFFLISAVFSSLFISLSLSCLVLECLPSPCLQPTCILCMCVCGLLFSFPAQFWTWV